jgi:hypothetical protein
MPANRLGSQNGDIEWQDGQHYHRGQRNRRRI